MPALAPAWALPNLPPPGDGGGRWRAVPDPVYWWSMTTPMGRTRRSSCSIMGFDARACYDGPAALAAAAVFLPDVCLLDFTMPIMCGDELAVRLREQAGGRPMLLVAA